jgi:undecaprenyl-diphosphatase
MNFLLLLKSILIGIIEGVTEFLPISSTGHMVLAGSIINFKGQFANLFEIFIQFGAILAVVVLFRHKIIASLKALRPGQFGFRLWLGILIAFIPAAVVGVIFNKKIEEYLFHPVPIAISLLVGGVVMIIAERRYKNNNKTVKPEDVTVKQGFIIGLFQCLSLWPGFSRSASTIIGGWVVGMTTAAAAEFTFFLAIPTMFAASGYSLIKSGLKLDASEVVMLIVGFVVAFIMALVVVKKFIDYLRHKPLRVFAHYRIIIGVIILILAATNIVKM